MIAVEQLWLFAVLVFGVMVLPGLDMAYVVGSSLAGGRARGMVALAGVIAGGVCHALMAALGIGVVLRVVPGLFNAMLLAGALYIGWIGISLMRHRPTGATIAAAPVAARSGWRTFRQGMLTCLLNPKAYLFMLAVFPQFLRPERGALWWQVLVLWLVIAMNQAAVYGSLALVAGHARDRTLQRPGSGALAVRCVGALLVATAAFTGWQGWQQA